MKKVRTKIIFSIAEANKKDSIHFLIWLDKITQNVCKCPEEIYNDRGEIHQERKAFVWTY